MFWLRNRHRDTFAFHLIFQLLRNGQAKGVDSIPPAKDHGQRDCDWLAVHSEWRRAYGGFGMHVRTEASSAGDSSGFRVWSVVEHRAHKSEGQEESHADSVWPITFIHLPLVKMGVG